MLGLATSITMQLKNIVILFYFTFSKSLSQSSFEYTNVNPNKQKHRTYTNTWNMWKQLLTGIRIFDHLTWYLLIFSSFSFWRQENGRHFLCPDKSFYTCTLINSGLHHFSSWCLRQWLGTSPPIMSSYLKKSPITAHCFLSLFLVVNPVHIHPPKRQRVHTRTKRNKEMKLFFPLTMILFFSNKNREKTIYDAEKRTAIWI